MSPNIVPTPTNRSTNRPARTPDLSGSNAAMQMPRTRSGRCSGPRSTICEKGGDRPMSRSDWSYPMVRQQVIEAMCCIQGGYSSEIMDRGRVCVSARYVNVCQSKPTEGTAAYRLMRRSASSAMRPVSVSYRRCGTRSNPGRATMRSLLGGVRAGRYRRFRQLQLSPRIARRPVHPSD